MGNVGHKYHMELTIESSEPVAAGEAKQVARRPGESMQVATPQGGGSNEMLTCRLVCH